MNKYKYIGYFLVMTLMLISCEERIDWNYNITDSGKLVVEAIITDEYKYQEVVLSLSRDDINGTQIPATGTIINLISENETYSFRENTSSPGTYLSENPFAGKLNKIYILEIKWENNTYRSKSIMKPVAPMNKITFKQTVDNKFTIDEVAPQYSPDEQAMYEIDIDWSHIENSDSAKAKLYFFTFKTIDVNEIFRPAKEIVKFPRGSIVIETKYSLNSQMAAYFRAMSMETQWQGGVFDEASGELPSNISNGALGLFGMSSVIKDTLIVK